MSSSSSKLSLLDLVVLTDGVIDVDQSAAVATQKVTEYFETQAKLTGIAGKVIDKLFASIPAGMTLPATLVVQQANAQIMNQRLLGDVAVTPALINQVTESLVMYLSKNTAEFDENDVKVQDGIFYSTKGQGGGLGLTKHRKPKVAKKAPKSALSTLSV